MGAFPFFEILPSPVREMPRQRYLRRYLRKRGRERRFPTRSSPTNLSCLSPFSSPPTSLHISRSNITLLLSRAGRIFEQP